MKHILRYARAESICWTTGWHWSMFVRDYICVSRCYSEYGMWSYSWDIELQESIKGNISE